MIRLIFFCFLKIEMNEGAEGREDEEANFEGLGKGDGPLVAQAVMGQIELRLIEFIYNRCHGEHEEIELLRFVHVGLPSGFVVLDFFLLWID